MLNGSILYTKSYIPDSTGNFVKLVDKYICMRQDSIFHHLITYDKKGYYLITDKDSILQLDQSFNIDDQIDLKEIYIQLFPGAFLTFLCKDDEVTVLDRQNHIIAILNIPEDAVLKGKKVYFSHGSDLLEIDISGLLENAE